MTPTTLPIFLNSQPIAATPGQTLGEVLAAHEPALLDAVRNHNGKATDARGIAVALDHVVYAGAIYRVFGSARREEPADA